MAHTPGPWKQHEDAPLYIMAKIGSKPGCIASVNHVEKGRGVIVEDETKANARLIASAPTMLAALKGIRDIADGLDDLSENWAKELDAVEAAILEAEGRAK